MGLFEWHKKYDIPIKRIIGISILIIIIISALLGTFTVTSNNDSVTKEDRNVYLNEPIQYASDVYITVNGINVETIISNNENKEYILNLSVGIESKHEKYHFRSAKLSNKNFQLKSVNLKSKSKFSIFIEALAKETLNAAVGIAVDGGINIIDETINYIGTYVEGSIDNAENKPDFKPIDTITIVDKFDPCKLTEVKNISLSFPIREEYLESENVIVLAIDSASHFEKHIFLTIRPSVV